MKLESVFEQRRLTATGTAGDEHVEPGFDARLHEHRHFRRERFVVQQVFELQRVGAEATNRERSGRRVRSAESPR